jgi:hypothetical protein
VRKTLTWLAGLAGIAALWRRRSHSAAPTAASVEAPLDPAVELRRKLEETRGTSAPASVADADPEPALSLDERRARVHERAHDAITLMRPDTPPDAGPEQGA